MNADSTLPPSFRVTVARVGVEMCSTGALRSAGPDQLDMDRRDLGFKDGLGLPTPAPDCPMTGLGRTGPAGLLDDNPAARRGERPEDLVEGHVPGRPLDLGDPGLAGLD